MKNLGRILLSEEPFSEIVIGDSAVARALVESGVRAITSYPGSPTPEIADALGAVPKAERPFYFEFSTNEKVALEVAFGAAINGHHAAVFFKSVGLNVAADSFVQLGLMDIPGGMLVILGDDPGANSSQNEQDNRHYAELACLPLLEPATAQEAYEMTMEASRIARERRTAVIVRLTTHVCHAKERVSFGAWKPEPPDRTPRFDPDASNYIPIAASVFPMKRRALARLQELRASFETSPLNRVTEGGDPRRGVIAAGTARLSLLDALEELPPERRPAVLELGTVYPLPHGLVRRFLDGREEVKILEELDPLLEREIKAEAYDWRATTRIVGKLDPEELVGEYLPAKVRGILADTWPDLGLAPKAAGAPGAGPERVPARPAQLCPGCGHRSAFFAIKKALAAEDITVADIGCHTLGHLPPYKMGRVLLSMGHSTATASGLSLWNDSRRVLCFLGDSTFFHAGMPAIVNAVYNAHNVTLVVMENGTTAMTGHQDHPGTGRNWNGEIPKIGVREALAGLGVANVREVDAYRQAELEAAVRAALAEPGFKVVIAKHPCMLKLTREARRKPGYLARSVAVSAAKCTRAHTCVSAFACPSFQLHADGSVTVSRELCIGDGSCRQVCPAEAIEAPAAAGKE
ncbi:MAG: 4Fe-4S binding protein [Spirochaetaceae bacterium]|nr:4Fe-4S binding protein [Spirochaetaceae bacterium]